MQDIIIDDSADLALREAADLLDRFRDFHDENTNEDGDPLDYREYDEGRNDFGEDALYMLETVLRELGRIS